MKFGHSNSSFRALTATTLLVSMLGQQLAMAAPAQAAAPVSLKALVTPKTGKQAVAVIQIAEERAVSAYFTNGATQAEIEAFSRDMAALTQANKLAGMTDDVSKYSPWFQAHQTSLIISRTKMRSTNLEGFFMESFIAYKAEETKNQKDPSALMNFLGAHVTSPIVRQMSATAWGVCAASFAFITGIAYGAIVAGPVAGSVGAFLDPVVRPFRERFSVIGNRWFGRFGAWINTKISSTQDSDEGGKEGLKDARGAQQKARALVNSMGHDMTASDFTKNVTSMQKVWNEMNRVWASINSSIFKDGRSLMFDAVAFRPNNQFAAPVLQAVHASETFRQGIEQMVDRIALRNSIDPKIVEAASSELLKAVDERERSDQKDPAKAEAAVALGQEKLVALGATKEQTERMISSRARELLFARHAAATLAANVIHDFQYEEFNRSLPDVLTEIQRVLRSNYCLDYFHKEFAVEVNRILTDLDFKLDVLTHSSDAATAEERGRARGLTSVKPTGETAPAKPVDAPVKVRPTLRERGSNVLGRLNALRGNRVAVERAVDPRTGREDRTITERAAEAVRGVRR